MWPTALSGIRLGCCCCSAHDQSGLLHCLGSATHYFGLTNILFLLQSVHLERLALYHDSDRLPWEIDKRWEDISPHEWIEVCLI
jgi:hypothetical protein